VENAELIVALYRDYCFLASGYSMEECHFNYQKNREYGEAKRILPKVIA
jgi:indoleamine 2,3-dioxygenase